MRELGASGVLFVARLTVFWRDLRRPLAGLGTWEQRVAREPCVFSYRGGNVARLRAGLAGFHLSPCVSPALPGFCYRRHRGLVFSAVPALAPPFPISSINFMFRR